MDDYVHPALTIQVVEALIKANKDFDLLIFPNANSIIDRLKLKFLSLKLLVCVASRCEVDHCDDMLFGQKREDRSIPPHPQAIKTPQPSGQGFDLRVFCRIHKIRQVG